MHCIAKKRIAIVSAWIGIAGERINNAANALVLYEDALALQEDTLTLQPIAKFNLLQINRMLY
ncbi:hypothetical protein [Nostoc sp.]|uniref:hypothetical protein n=1 Tax=Nostoc sp. TaxID=1180 RepID=UPI002FF8C5E3